MQDVESNVYDDEFEEFRVRANSGGTLPESWRRRKELLIQHKNRHHSESSYSGDGSRHSSLKGTRCRNGNKDEDSTVPRTRSVRKTSTHSAGTSGHRSVSRKSSAGSPPKQDNMPSNGTCNSRSHSHMIPCKEQEDPFRYYETSEPYKEAEPKSERVERDLLICNKQFDEFSIQDRPMRPRVSTMPSRSEMIRMRTKHKGHTLSATKTGTVTEHRRVRSFKITSKGVVRSTESFVVRGHNEAGHSPGSDERLSFDWLLRNGSVSSLGSSQSEASNEHKIYNVAMLGAESVGKRSLIQRFISSDCNGSQNFSFDEDGDKSVAVLLDGEESTLEFSFSGSKKQESAPFGNMSVDAYVIVYSVVDRKSFQDAIDLLFDIQQRKRKVAVILVANKTDLVRSRDVMGEEGKAAAEAYVCKYAEVSAVLVHHVDELLVGILTQIRLIEQQKEKHHGKCRPAFGTGDDTCCLATKQGLIGRLLGAYQSKSCDNLLVL